MPEIIAEIANAHQGNPITAIKLAKSAKISGADAVKFQIYFADDFISKNHSRFDHFKKQSFSKNSKCPDQLVATTGTPAAAASTKGRP